MKAVLCFAMVCGTSLAQISDFDTSCYEESDKGKAYKGLVTQTSSGRTCQNWLKDKPHSVSTAPSTANGLGNHNYCRNPDGSEDKPWCYTMDPSPDHEKETCDIPICPPAARDFVDEAKTLATKVAPELDCECAAQLYGATTTTADTRVSLASRRVRSWKGKVVDGKCHCLK